MATRPTNTRGTDKTRYKNCEICSKLFFRRVFISLKKWKNRKYCSKKCYWTTVSKFIKNRSVSKETRKKMSLSGHGYKQNHVPWNKGIKSWVKPWLGKQRLNMRKEIKSRWKEYRRQLAGRLEYITWRMAVFQRDKFTCQNCEAKGVYLEADHIKRAKEFPELILDINNGQTLCKKCHRIKCVKEQIK